MEMEMEKWNIFFSIRKVLLLLLLLLRLLLLETRRISAFSSPSLGNATRKQARHNNCLLN